MAAIVGHGNRTYSMATQLDSAVYGRLHEPSVEYLPRDHVRGPGHHPNRGGPGREPDPQPIDAGVPGLDPDHPDRGQHVQDMRGDPVTAGFVPREIVTVEEQNSRVRPCPPG